MAKDIRIRRVRGKRAWERWQSLRAAFPESGVYPVLLGDKEEYETVRETYDCNRSEFGPAAEMIAQSRTETAQAWFAARREELDLDDAWLTQEDAKWPAPTGEVDQPEIHTHLDLLKGRPKKIVYIAEAKVSAGWEAFAQLAWGGFNECPFPHEHCLLHRTWAEEYGAELVSMSDAVVECRVARPPQTRQAALALAKQQYLYCPDIVDQGTESIVGLAAELLKCPYWFFWWD